jgi:hypothetical protein
VCIFWQGEFGLRGRDSGGRFADGDPVAVPAAHGEAFEDVVVVGLTGGAPGLAGGTVLQGLVENRGEGNKRTKEIRAGIVRCVMLRLRRGKTCGVRLS